MAAASAVMPVAVMNDSPLYLLTPPRIDDESFFWRHMENIVGTGMVGMVQLRLKGASMARYDSVTPRLLALCRQASVRLMMNDDSQLACHYDCDGVHIGKDDSDDMEAVRRLMGKTRVMGVSCYGSLARAEAAQAAGADYVAFGSFFSSVTKPRPSARPDVSLLTQWRSISSCAAVAIGGIDVSNVGAVFKAGADYVALAGAIWNSDDPTAMMKKIYRQWHDKSGSPLNNKNRRSIPRAMPVTAGRSSMACRNDSSGALFHKDKRS